MSDYKWLDEILKDYREPPYLSILEEANLELAKQAIIKEVDKEVRKAREDEREKTIQLVISIDRHIEDGAKELEKKLRKQIESLKGDKNG